jgi:hypothetical protein
MAAYPGCMSHASDLAGAPATSRRAERSKIVQRMIAGAEVLLDQRMRCAAGRREHHERIKT